MYLVAANGASCAVHLPPFQQRDPLCAGADVRWACPRWPKRTGGAVSDCPLSGTATFRSSDELRQGGS